MPVNNRQPRRWLELKTFGGLWTAGESTLMPENAAQVMSGCHPQPGGGLRAFWRVVDTKGAGLSDFNGALASTFSSSGMTGDLDVRTKFAGPTWTFGTATIGTFIIAQHDGGVGARNFNFYYDYGAQRLVFQFSTDGTNWITKTASTALPAFSSNQGVWFRVVHDVNNGAAGNDVLFYYSTNATDTHTSVTWTQLGTTQTTAGTVTRFNANTFLKVGVSQFFGWVAAFAILNGIGGAAVASKVFTGVSLASNQFTDDQAHFWVSSETVAWSGGPSTPIGLFIASYKEAGSTTETPLFYLVTTEGLTSTGHMVWRYRSTSDWPMTTWLAERSVGTYNPSFAIVRIGTVSSSVSYIFATGVHQFGYPQQIDPAPVSGKKMGLNTSLVATYSDLTWGSSFTGTMVVQHQDRVVVANDSRIRATEPGTIDFTTASAAKISIGQGDGAGSSALSAESQKIVWMIPVPPGDLVVGTRGGRIYNVQGDLSDPVIRDLGTWPSMEYQIPILSPMGMFFAIPGQGVVNLQLDGSVETISKELDPSIWQRRVSGSGIGQFAATERYLFCPNQHPATEHKNGPLVWDSETGAWFTATHSDDFTITNPTIMAADNNTENAGIWVAKGTGFSRVDLGNTDNSGAGLFQYRTGISTSSSAGTEDRAATWEWKSAPLRSPDGRYVRVHEVNLNCFAFNASSTVAVTVGETTVTKTLPAGKSVQRFLFRKQGDYLDVDVKAKSNDTSIEAPMLEAARVAWSEGPTIR